MIQMIRISIMIIMITTCSQQLYSQTRYFVDASASGNDDGSSWTDAFSSFQSALDVATFGDEIWVAAGTYKPSSPYDLTDSPRFYHFRMIEGVAIYGGFAGNEDPETFDLGDRDFETNETIFSGDIGTIGDDSDNCFHLFFHPNGLGLSNAAILDGFTIRDGNANGTAPHDKGGGIYNINNNPAFINCIFQNNKAYDRGGAAYFDESTLSFTDCTFESNTSVNSDGGAIFITDNPGDINFLRCSIKNNSSDYNGGAIYIIYAYGGQIGFEECTFDDNSSLNQGGAVYIYDANLKFDNCTFSNNNAKDGGAIYQYFGDALTIDNCIFDNNSADYGGAVNGDGDFSIHITNTVFTSNSANSGGAVFCRNYITLDIDESEFSNNNVVYDGGAIYLVDDVYSNIDNTTFSENSAENGGAVYLEDNSDIFLNNSIFESNTANNYGGSLYLYQDIYANIQNTSFTENSADHGGAIFAEDNSIIDIENSLFDNNTAYAYGGAISIEYIVELEILKSNFENNSAGWGGAIYTDYESEVTTNFSIFNNNTADNNGGAIFVEYYSSFYSLSTIFSNNSAYYGGSYYCAVSSTSGINNSLFYGNSAINGGAIVVSDSDLDCINCTLADNTASNDGGAVYVYNDVEASLKNSIIWGNTAINNGNQFYLEDNSNIEVHYSCFSNGINDVYEDYSSTFSDINSLEDDPKFVSHATNDYRIKGNSPAADAGNDDETIQPWDIRGTGYPRKLDKNDYTQVGTVDMGAYEYNSNTDPSGEFIFVKHNALGNNDGTSWDDAFILLQSALEVAQAGDNIFVASGVYKPSSDNGLGDGSDPRLFHFQMLPGVRIYGGFAGNEDPVTFDLGDRDFVTNETILSGDLDGNDDFDINNAGYQGVSGNDNTYHVIFNPDGLNLIGTSILDGFTITGGNANGLDGLHDLGGGIYNYKNEPIFRNLIIKNNYADGGSAIYNYNCNPSITNALIVNNVSQFGAVWIRELAIPSFTNVTISRNHSYYGGGIFINGFSDPVFNNSIVAGNTSDDLGRQIFLSSYSTLTYNYCNYSNNSGDNFIGTEATFITLNSITDNPQFVNAANGDFRLYSFSPGVDAGNNSYNSLPADIRGQARIQNTTIDMGAYEWTEGIDPECVGNIFISDLYDGDSPGWGVTQFDNLNDAFDLACDGATINISNYTHTGDVDMTGYTFIIGDGDFNLNGVLSGGLIQTPSTGRLILPAVQNVQRNYPMGNGANNFTLKIIPGNVPTNPIFVRLVEKSVPGAVKSPMPFWEIEGDDDLDATIVFRIDKSAISPKTLNTNSLLRFFDGDTYLPFTEEQVTISDKGLYYEIVIINVNKF